MRGERQAHLVPAVHEDVRVVVGRLGEPRPRGRRTRSPRRSRRTSARARSRSPLAATRRPARRCSICASLSSAIVLASIPAARGRRSARRRRRGAGARRVLLVRIVSLVPHATELLFALGLGPEVVAVTHECDHPPGGARAQARHARRAARRPERRRDRRGGARAHAGGRGDLRARPARRWRSSSPT